MNECVFNFVIFAISLTSQALKDCSQNARRLQMIDSSVNYISMVKFSLSVSHELLLFVSSSAPRVKRGAVIDTSYRWTVTTDGNGNNIVNIMYTIDDGM